MFRLIGSIILSGIAIAGFFVFTNPLFKEISLLRDEVIDYDEALSNSKALENERDKLTNRYNSITIENLDKLQRLLPDNVDNIRLILEIEKIASPYGMVLKDVRYDTFTKKDATAAANPITTPTGKDYGIWALEFSTQGIYSNFINFIKDLDANLRIVDISSIEFTSDSGGGLNPVGLTESYKYSFKINTYWLKN
jgi:Tfp pilus assembly protein PilO